MGLVSAFCSSCSFWRAWCCANGRVGSTRAAQAGEGWLFGGGGLCCSSKRASSIEEAGPTDHKKGIEVLCGVVIVCWRCWVWRSVLVTPPAD